MISVWGLMQAAENIFFLSQKQQTDESSIEKKLAKIHRTASVNCAIFTSSRYWFYSRENLSRQRLTSLNIFHLNSLICKKNHAHFAYFPTLRDICQINHLLANELIKSKARQKAREDALNFHRMYSNISHFSFTSNLYYELYIFVCYCCGWV